MKRVEVTTLQAETLVLRVIVETQLWLVALAEQLLHPLAAVPTLFPSVNLQIL